MSTKRKSNAGRNSKLTREVIREICKHIAIGTPQKIAATMCGVAESTFYKWINEDTKTGNELALELSESLKKARAESIAIRVANIRKQAKKNWTADAWWLERQCPEFRRQDKVIQEISGPDGGVIPVATVDLTKLSIGELRVLEDLCRKASSSSS